MFINNILSNNVYVYQSWQNLGTMGVSSRIGVISVKYKKVIKKILYNTDPSHSSLDAITFLFLNINHIILHNGQNKSATIKNITILHTFSAIRDIIDV